MYTYDITDSKYIFITDMIQDAGLSDAVYVGMCREIGTPTEVRIRREVVDTKDIAAKPLWILQGLHKMMSGSNREGFRFKKSDTDWMLWPHNYKVIDDPSQIILNSNPRHTVFLMEFDDLQPPGFPRLKLVTSNPLLIRILWSCIVINDKIYLSSSLFRNIFLHHTQQLSPGHASAIQHGPCSTITFMNQDIDFAFCLRSHHWPNIALPWIQRCQLKKWPPNCVLSSVIQEGCHVVPINSSTSNLKRDCEWRLSFSGAERIIVYSFNHCQFLCYGLLKIFLTEIINEGKRDSCLCSYFMKTVVFWVIQNDTFMKWVPSNLLMCFWTCFKLLISWVYRGECPNFFIPQNNMFRVKVVGHRQAALFDELHALYCNGISCLLSSPTLADLLKMPILNRTPALRTDENSIIMMFDILMDEHLFLEVSMLLTFRLYVVDRREFAGLLLALEQLQKARLTVFQSITVQYVLSSLLRNFAFCISTQNLAILSNRKRTFIYDNSLNMLKLASKIGCASEILHLALYYYRNCQYLQSIKCLQKAQEKMLKPYVIYRQHVDKKIYRGSMEGVSLSNKMRKCLMSDIEICAYYFYIDELVPEQAASMSDGNALLQIHHLVMLLMLNVLNHRRLGNKDRSDESLMHLYLLVLNDSGTYIPSDSRDTSWQMLGICLQTCGYYQLALPIFMFSLRNITPVNRIQKATTLRILLILYHIWTCFFGNEKD